MKQLILMILSICMLSCNPSASDEHKSQAGKTSNTKNQMDTTAASPQTIEDIKAQYQNVNEKFKSGKLDSAAVKYDCSGERKGTITYFSEKGRLKLLRHQYHEYDHYSALEEYYVNGEDLYFVYQQSMVWSFVSGAAAQGASKEQITEKRFYIAENNMLRNLEAKYTRYTAKASDENIKKEVSKTPDKNILKSILNKFGKLKAFKNTPDKDCPEF